MASGSFFFADFQTAFQLIEMLILKSAKIDFQSVFKNRAKNVTETVILCAANTEMCVLCEKDSL